MTDEDARWAEALTSLEHGPTPTVRARVRKRLRLILGIAGPVLLVGLVVPLLLPDRPDEPRADDGTTALEFAGLVVMGVAVLLLAIAVYLLFRTWRGRWVSPLTPLTRQQTRTLFAQVRGTEPVVTEHLPLARHVAETMLMQRPVLLLLLGVVVQLVGLAMLNSSWWWAAAAAAYAVIAVGGWRTFRRHERAARRFLEQHPEPAA